MNYWLFKSEPDTWCWDQQKKEGAKGAEWDGVNLYEAGRGEVRLYILPGKEKP